MKILFNFRDVNQINKSKIISESFIEVNHFLQLLIMTVRKNPTRKKKNWLDKNYSLKKIMLKITIKNNLL